MGPAAAVASGSGLNDGGAETLLWFAANHRHPQQQAHAMYRCLSKPGRLLYGRTEQAGTLALRTYTDVQYSNPPHPSRPRRGVFCGGPDENSENSLGWRA
jgi:hypothetical protein